MAELIVCPYKFNPRLASGTKLMIRRMDPIRLFRAPTS